MAERLLALEEVCERVELSRATIFKEIKDGTFPAPLRLSPKKIRWADFTIDNFLADLAKQAERETRRRRKKR